MGRWLEDFTVGEVIKHWPGRTIRDFDDTWFTLMTMNTNPLHFDDHFASQSQHGRCLVNGVLVFAITDQTLWSFSREPHAARKNRFLEIIDLTLASPHLNTRLYICLGDFEWLTLAVHL